ncbi:hypothetical protein DF286_10820 [Sphingosinicella humi]|uniref:Uncharacterized protein n=1 Tax=Allosphingosinicella humi TaxID=2068657 RepID=A0A2U2J4R1_9SPHN|nr:hypothetical protein DF286_10820 [Sphingosinicella humi]
MVIFSLKALASRSGLQGSTMPGSQPRILPAIADWPRRNCLELDTGGEMRRGGGDLDQHCLRVAPIGLCRCSGRCLGARTAPRPLVRKAIGGTGPPIVAHMLG